MAYVNLRYLRAKQLQAVDEPAQPPRPLAVGAVVLERGVQPVEVMFSSLVVLAPLPVVVHLLLVVGHRGDGTSLKQLEGQRKHAGANHQRIRRRTRLGIVNCRA